MAVPARPVDCIEVVNPTIMGLDPDITYILRVANTGYVLLS
jgi:hypothetical protein